VSAQRARRPARRRPWWRGALPVFATVVAVAVVFVLGMAVGRATEDELPDGTQTVDRTLRVETLTPAVETVTVTVETGG
jgi:flagellin-like protein